MARQGQRFSSGELHARFGPAFRTRVSEINHDSACPVRIVNETTSDRDGNGRPCERSFYQAERRIREDHSSESGAPAQAGVDDWFVRATGKPRPRTDASGNPLLFVETRA